MPLFEYVYFTEDGRRVVVEKLMKARETVIKVVDPEDEKEYNAYVILSLPRPCGKHGGPLGS
jgi:hypothetical protein